jgi:hypothetical protein
MLQRDDWLVLEAFQAVRKGTPPCITIEEWGEPVNRYEFEDFAILTKGAGSRGVDLLRR